MTMARVCYPWAMLALLCLPAALAFSSETQDVHFEDLADVFQGAEFSTGWVPGGSPIAVQFAIESNGGADVGMDGTADLSWPSPFRLDYTPEPESGSLILDASIDAVTSIQIDLSDWGYYGTFELDRRSMPVRADTSFDPFKLDGSVDQRVEVVDEGNPNELIYYSYEIIAGLSLDFSATIRTRSVVGFQGVSITTGDQVLTQEGQAAALPVAGEASYLVDSTFRGAWDTTVDLLLTPEAEACSAFGCVTLLSFDIPFTLLSDAFEQDFPQAQQIFPLPLQVVDTTDRDLGDVTVGGVGNLDGLPG
jgi:hypothetical protein